MNNFSPKASAQSAFFLSLMDSSRKGNNSILESLFKNVRFSQEELDEAFRNCIKNYSKKKHDTFKKCIKLFLKIPDIINYKNPNHNNTTILMYCFEIGQEVPSDIILKNAVLDVTLIDNKGENCLFKLIQNSDLHEQTQIEFLKRLIKMKLDLNVRNNRGENVMDIINSLGKTNMKRTVQTYIQNARFDIIKYIDLYNKEEYNELIQIITKFNSCEEGNNVKYKNLKFEYNKLFIQMKLKTKVNSDNNGNANNIPSNSKELIENKSHIIKFLTDDIKINSHLPHIQILLLNKLFMLYQLGHFNQFIKLKKELSNNDEFLMDKLFYIYIQCIYIDFLYERHLFDKAKIQLELLKTHFNDKLSFLEFQTEENLIIYKEFFSKAKLFNITNEDDFNKLIKLYSISFMIYENNNNANELIEGNIPLTKPQIKQALNEINQLKIEESNTSSLILEFYNFLQIHLIYYSSHFTLNKINDKLEKLLNTTVQNSNNIHSEISLLFYYNTNGILNIKKSNYALASFYFLKCIQIIKNKTTFYFLKLKHYYPQIAFNLALSYFFQKNYSKCISILSSLLNNNNTDYLLKYRKHVYYRLALAQLELYMKQSKNEREQYFEIYEKELENEIKGIKSNKTNSFDSTKITLFPPSIKENFIKTLLLIKNNKNDQIYFNTIINIVYCCIKQREFTEALFYLNNKLKGLHLSSQQNILVKSYVLQIHFYIKNATRGIKMFYD